MQTAKESVRVLHSLLTRRKRFTHAPNSYGLDLAYITDRVIVCSFPYELPLFFSRNNAGELLKFLEATHKDHYKVYNLCAERKYDGGKFKGSVIEFPVNVNEAPQLYTIYSFIKDVNKWLDSDPMNVVCVHCDNGRDRTGMMVSAWLLQTKRCLTASHAITFFASVRGGISPCVTIPSQRRYVEYVERVLTEKMPAIKLVVLEKITIYTVPMFNLRGGCSPWFSISKLNKSIFYSKSLEGRKGKMSIDFECNFIQLQGDIVIAFFDGKFSRLMFRISLHTSFIRGKTVTFYPRDIDGPHMDVNHKNFNPEFKVTLHFSSVALLPSEQICPDDVVPQSKKYTFDDILNTPTLCEAFRAYLVEYRCSENVDFWKNVQRYKNVYVPSIAKPVATKMYNKYILRHAPEEVNISFEAREDVEAGLALDEPPQNVFALAEKEIYSLMRNDSYPRFIISDLFFKACAELSDYASTTPGPLPSPASPRQSPIRPYANTAPQGVAADKQPITRRFPTGSASEGSSSSSSSPSSSPPLSASTGSEYTSPFKMIDEKLVRKQESGKRPESPRKISREASKGSDEVKKDFINADTSRPRAGSGSRNILAGAARKTPTSQDHAGSSLNLGRLRKESFTLSRKEYEITSPRDVPAPRKEYEIAAPRDIPISRREYIPMSPRRKQDSPRNNPESAFKKQESPRKDQESPRKDQGSPRTDQELLVTNSQAKPYHIATKDSAPERSDSPLQFTSSLSSHSRIQHAEREKRHDFIKGDYRSPKTESTPRDDPSRLPHLDLHRPPSDANSSGQPTSPQTMRSLRTNTKISQSYPELPSFQPAFPSQNSNLNKTSRLSQTQVISPPKLRVIWEEPQKPQNAESPPRVRFDVPESDNRNLTIQRPSSPITAPPPDAVDAHLTRKNVAQKIQSLSPPVLSLAHSASAPSIISPSKEPTENVNSTRTSKSSFILPSGGERKLSSTSANQYKFPRVPPPQRPDSPDIFSPAVLSFERTTSHETLETNTNAPSDTPSTYPATISSHADQAESLKVMDNMKLVCVECKKQIGNKDVVVSFMHHYYHWSCVRCFKCHQPLSSDCVITGDKPICGKCEDSFFNKCDLCGLSITETSEEQRFDPDGTMHSWHRRCFACSMCGAASNSECPIDRNPTDRKLYCVFHHPEPRSVPVMSAQDSREDDTSDYFSLDRSDSSDDDSPPLSPPLSPAPSPPPPASPPASPPRARKKIPPHPDKPLPALPTSPLKMASPPKALQIPAKPLPTPALSPKMNDTQNRNPSSPKMNGNPVSPKITGNLSSGNPSNDTTPKTNDNAKPNHTRDRKPLPPIPPMRPTVVSTPAPAPISSQATRSAFFPLSSASAQLPRNTPAARTAPASTPAPVTPASSTPASTLAPTPAPTPASTAPASAPASPNYSPARTLQKLTLADAYFPGVCAACGSRVPKSGQLLLAGGSQYHPACFACSVCAAPITGTYQEFEGAVYCARHPVGTHARRQRCAGCDNPIAQGKYLLVGEDKYHMECFGCKLCGLQFGSQHNYYNLWGGHICLPCYESSWRLKNRNRIYNR